MLLYHSLMNKESIKILKKASSFSSYSHKIPPPPTVLPFNNFTPTSPSTTTSLQTLPNSNSNKSLSNPLYNFLPQTQNPNNLVNLIYASLKQCNWNPDLDHIKGLLPYLGPTEISRVLLRCQSDSVSALTFFNWVKDDLGLKPSAHNYCLVVHILAWSNEFKQAMKFLVELVRDYSVSEDVFQCLVLCCEGCNWNPVVFDMLIKAYLKVGLAKEGFGAFLKAVEIGFVPSVIACNCLLNGLSKSNCIDQCWRVYKEMGRIGIHMNSHTFNILTYVFCENGDIDKVNEFLDKMEEEGFEPDIVTYNTLIDSYSKKGRLNDAFYLYKIMYRRGVLPDLVSYTALMNGLCRQSKVRDAHQLFHKMVHRGLNPDVVTYNTLMFCYCKEGRMQESRSLLYEMIGNGIRPDSFTCRVLIEGYGKEGKLLSALNLIVELEKFRVPISQEIYDRFIVSLCEADRPFAAKSLLERILLRDYVPGFDVYNNLVASLCKFDSVTDALLLKVEMVRRNLKPNIDTYGSLICCFCRIRKTSEAYSLMEEMLQSGLPPDPGICRALIEGYCMERDAGKAESLLRFFAKEFKVFDNESYNKLFKISSEDGDMAKLMELQDRMLKVGYAPNRLTCKYIIQALQKTEELDEEKLLLR